VRSKVQPEAGIGEHHALGNQTGLPGAGAQAPRNAAALRLEHVRGVSRWNAAVSGSPPVKPEKPRIPIRLAAAGTKIGYAERVTGVIHADLNDTVERDSGE
jgi:hypothetical protein